MRIWVLDAILCTEYDISRCIQHTWKQAARCTSFHAPKYTPDCSRLHTPSLLDCTLPGMLSETLPGTPPSTLPSTPPTDSQDTPTYPSEYAPKDTSGSVSSTLFGSRLPTTLLSKTVPISLDYGGRYHDVSWHHALNLIFSMATATRSHDASWWWCLQLQP